MIIFKEGRKYVQSLLQILFNTAKRINPKFVWEKPPVCLFGNLANRVGNTPTLQIQPG